MSAHFPQLPDIKIPGTSGDRLFRPPLVMGILNVTPDSFSDGGRFVGARLASPVNVDEAVNRALSMFAGEASLAPTGSADIIDIGGESTRPGAAAVSEREETSRTIPLIAALRARGVDAPISIDTTKATVAEAALDAGADIVNDVSAASDPAMLALCAKRQCGLILMHMRGNPRDMQKQTDYADVVDEVRQYLQSRVDAAIAAGVARECIWIDPGFGFAKLPDHNCALVSRLAEFSQLGLPVLLGASRKSTLGHLTGRPVGDREPESLAAGLMAALNGASILRVHEPGPMKRALLVAKAMQGNG